MTALAKKCKCAAHAGDERWHGLPTGRQYHGCDCERCRDGTAKYHADYWQARKAGQTPRVRVCSTCGEEFSGRTRARYCSPECRAAGLSDFGRQREVRRTEQLAARRRRLLAAQGGVCALCRKPLKLAQATVDHDHTCCDTKARRACGKCDRGAVHRHCNTLLGAARDSGETLEYAQQYLGWQRQVL